MLIETSLAACHQNPAEEKNRWNKLRADFWGKHSYNYKVAVCLTTRIPPYSIWKNLKSMSQRLVMARLFLLKDQAVQELESDIFQCPTLSPLLQSRREDVKAFVELLKELTVCAWKDHVDEEMLAALPSKMSWDLTWRAASFLENIYGYSGGGNLSHLGHYFFDSSASTPIYQRIVSALLPPTLFPDPTPLPESLTQWLKKKHRFQEADLYVKSVMLSWGNMSEESQRAWRVSLQKTCIATYLIENHETLVDENLAPVCAAFEAINQFLATINPQEKIEDILWRWICSSSRPSRVFLIHLEPLFVLIRPDPAPIDIPFLEPDEKNHEARSAELKRLFVPIQPQKWDPSKIVAGYLLKQIFVEKGLRDLKEKKYSELDLHQLDDYGKWVRYNIALVKNQTFEERYEFVSTQCEADWRTAWPLMGLWYKTRRRYVTGELWCECIDACANALRVFRYYFPHVDNLALSERSLFYWENSEWAGLYALIDPLNEWKRWKSLGEQRPYFRPAQLKKLRWKAPARVRQGYWSWGHSPHVKNSPVNFTLGFYLITRCFVDFKPPSMSQEYNRFAGKLEGPEFYTYQYLVGDFQQFFEINTILRHQNPVQDTLFLETEKSALGARCACPLRVESGEESEEENAAEEESASLAELIAPHLEKTLKKTIHDLNRKHFFDYQAMFHNRVWRWQQSWESIQHIIPRFDIDKNGGGYASLDEAACKKEWLYHAVAPAALLLQEALIFERYLFDIPQQEADRRGWMVKSHLMHDNCLLEAGHISLIYAPASKKIFHAYFVCAGAKQYRMEPALFSDFVLIQKSDVLPPHLFFDEASGAISFALDAHYSYQLLPHEKMER